MIPSWIKRVPLVRTGRARVHDWVLSRRARRDPAEQGAAGSARKFSFGNIGWRLKVAIQTLTRRDLTRAVDCWMILSRAAYHRIDRTFAFWTLVRVR